MGFSVLITGTARMKAQGAKRTWPKRRCEKKTEYGLSRDNEGKRMSSKR